MLWKRATLAWLPIAVAVTCLGFLGYAAVQQAYRTGADDPQVQMAHDGAAAIAKGGSPQQVAEAARRAVGSDSDVVLDPAVSETPGGSLAPFVIVYDVSGEPLASSATLNGGVPRIPQGVLQVARATGENRVTWQPESWLRIAAVAVPVAKGDRVVVAGRSLAEVERRIGALGQMALVGWVFTLGATFVAVLLAEKLREKA